jgi:hypothetical protein
MKKTDGFIREDGADRKSEYLDAAQWNLEVEQRSNKNNGKGVNPSQEENK